MPINTQPHYLTTRPHALAPLIVAALLAPVVASGAQLGTGLQQLMDGICPVLGRDGMTTMINSVMSANATVRIGGSGSSAPWVIDNYPLQVGDGLYDAFEGLYLCPLAATPTLPLMDVTSLNNPNSVGGWAQRQDLMIASKGLDCGGSAPRYVFGEVDADGKITDLNDAFRGDAMGLLGAVVAGKCGDITPGPSGPLEAERSLMEARLVTWAQDLTSRGTECYDGSHFATETEERYKSWHASMPPAQYALKISDVIRFDTRQAVATITVLMVVGKDVSCAGTYASRNIAVVSYDTDYKISRIKWHSDSPMWDELKTCGKEMKKDEL